MDMKKIITCAALLAGIVFFNGRLNAQVESDIVGYINPTMNPSLTMLAVPFTALTSTDDSIAINDLLQGNFAAGDTIQIFDGISSYTTLTYRTTSTLNGNNMGPAWCEGRSNYSTIELAAGDCFWINTKATVTLIGKVSSTKALALDANSLHMIANTQPVDIAINDITFEGVSAGDTIQIFDGVSSYTTLTYRAASTLNGVAMGAAWCEGRNTYSQAKILAGTGFWINTKADVTVTF